jgi:hypothetical protein
MVFIEDSGSHFEAPVDKIWTLIQAHGKDGAKIHPGMKNMKLEMINDNTMINNYESDMKGKTIKNKIKITTYHPTGMAIEILEGPLAGSKFFNYLIPKGNRTGVTVVGEFKSNMMSDDQIKQSVLSYLDQVFNEDVAYLKTMST